MGPVLLEVTDIPDCERTVVSDHKKVFRVLLLGRLGEVEGSGNQDAPVDDHDFIVGYGMTVVYVGGDSAVHEKVGRRILLPALAFVQHHLDPDAPLPCFQKGFGNRCAGKGVGLNQDLAPGVSYLRYNCFGGAALGLKVNADGIGGFEGFGMNGKEEWSGKKQNDWYNEKPDFHSNENSRGIPSLSTMNDPILCQQNGAEHCFRLHPSRNAASFSS
jgi:hypothetical protein